MRVRNEQTYIEKKNQIMEACYECYAENGLHGTGIAALADAAKFPKPPSIYTLKILMN